MMRYMFMNFLDDGIYPSPGVFSTRARLSRSAKIAPFSFHLQTDPRMIQTRAQQPTQPPIQVVHLIIAGLSAHCPIVLIIKIAALIAQQMRPIFIQRINLVPHSIPYSPASSSVGYAFPFATQHPSYPSFQSGFLNVYMAKKQMRTPYMAPPQINWQEAPPLEAFLVKEQLSI